MKRPDPQLVSTIITDMIERLGMTDQMRRDKAAALWPKVAGEAIAALTTRVNVADTTLHVWISSAPLKEELGYARQNLMLAINSALGQDFITNIAIH